MTDHDHRIALRGITKRYGSVPAVEGLDLDIDAGQAIALLGPNGAGKTTTLDIMLGLTKPDTGSVSLFGYPPREASARGLVGGMLQTGTPLEGLRVRELVAMVGSLYPDPLPLEDVLEMTGALDFANTRTESLSGGQAQRTRLAVALVGNPRLLVLDEPTAAIDVEGRREFWQVIEGLKSSRKTIVFATHYLEEADQHADRVVLIAKGRIVADGPAASIKSMVTTRTIRMLADDIDASIVAGLDGVASARVEGATMVVTCTDSDAAIYALTRRFDHLREIEIMGGTLEEAFFTLTHTEEQR